MPSRLRPGRRYQWLTEPWSLPRSDPPLSREMPLTAVPVIKDDTRRRVYVAVLFTCLRVTRENPLSPALFR
jgi:hypothetical protein